MKELICIFLFGLIILFWYLSNLYSKPILNKMKNFYEEDEEGKVIANTLIGLMLIIAFIIGAILF